jgi:glycosyltransferase involved in cell wall biosynthesis
MPETDRMKIAFVYDVIYPYVKGGVEKRVWELAVRLAKQGHEIHIFCMKYWVGDNIQIRDDVILHGICPAKNLYAGNRRTVGEAIYFAMRLIVPLAREQFDIIDCQQFPFIPCIPVRFISCARKIPLVITWHEVWGDYWLEYLGSKGVLGKVTERYIASFGSKVIAVSSTTAIRFTMQFGRQPDIIIPNGIDIYHLESVSPSPTVSDIIFVGRLIKEKNVDILIRAFQILIREYPDIRLTVIGNGPEQDSIRSLVRNLSLEGHVKLLGFQDSHDEVFALMKSSRVFVLPSTREGFGITALEALACGLPVITIDHPANAIRDLINIRTGFLSTFSAEDLAGKIREALNHHVEMRDTCIATAAAYDWDSIAVACEEYYRSVIAKKAGGTGTRSAIRKHDG